MPNFLSGFSWIYGIYWRCGEGRAGIGKGNRGVGSRWGCSRTAGFRGSGAPMSVGFFLNVFAVAGLMERGRLETERVMPGGDHGERYRRAIRFGMHVFGLKPGAEPGIEDFRLTLPEVWIQSALNIEMVELQFDCWNVFTEISPHIGLANMKPSDTTAFRVSFYDHRYLLFNTGKG